MPHAVGRRAKETLRSVGRGCVVVPHHRLVLLLLLLLLLMLLLLTCVSRALETLKKNGGSGPSINKS